MDSNQRNMILASVANPLLRTNDFFKASTTNQHNKTKKSVKGKKKVRFARSKQNFAPSYPFDCATQWYQRADYETFKSQAAADVDNVMSSTQSLTNCIFHAYETASRMASSAADEITLMEPLEKLGPDFQLLLWCNAVWCRGNEKTMLNSITMDKLSRTKANHRSVVLMSQKRCDDNTLRIHSEDLSRTNRIFARMIGVADACIALRSLKSRKSKRKTPPTETEGVEDPCHPSAITTMASSDPCSDSLQLHQLCAQLA